MITHVSLGFAQLPDANLADFATGVHDGLLANAATFTTPPVTPAALATATGAFSSALAAANKGSVAQTAAKDVAHDTLVNLLRQLAIYVEGKANGDANTIRLAGFEAVTASGRNPQSPLDKPSIVSIINEVSTQLLLRASSIQNAHAYEVQMQTAGGTWTATGTFTQARRIVIASLTPGTVYTFRIRAIGGSTGHSDWSDPVSHMAT